MVGKPDGSMLKRDIPWEKANAEEKNTPMSSNNFMESSLKMNKTGCYYQFLQCIYSSVLSHYS